MTKKWLREREKDPYYRRAKEEGFRSRAVYKLLQISKKHNLIKRGDVIVDLGAFPGGWIQGARLLVGEEGYVLGIDLKDIKDFDWSNVKTFMSDITILDAFEILSKLPRKADVVLSDVSPNISGIWEVDHTRQIDMARNAHQIALKILRRRGNFLVKAFQGEFFKDFLEEVKISFVNVKIVKPMASRKRSAEVYIIALGFHRTKRNKPVA